MWLSHHKVSSSVCCSTCLVKRLTLLCVQRWATHKARHSLPANKPRLPEQYIIESIQVKPENKTKLKSKHAKEGSSNVNCVNGISSTLPCTLSCDSSSTNGVKSALEGGKQKESSKSCPRERKQKQRSEIENAKRKQKEKVNVTCRQKVKNKVVLSSSSSHQSSLELESLASPLSSPSTSLFAQLETLQSNQSANQSISLSQFTEEALKENDIRLGMRLLMMTYFSKKHYDKKPRADEMSKERERLQEKHKPSRERLETKTLNSQQLLSKEGNRIGDGIVPLFVKPSSHVSDKSKANNARSWMDLNPVATNQKEQKSKESAVSNESLEHKLATSCEAAADICEEKMSSSFKSNNLHTRATQTSSLVNNNVYNHNYKSAFSQNSEFTNVNENVVHNNIEIALNEDSNAELDNNNNNNNINKEESIELDLLEDLSRDTFKDASLEELCLPDLSLYTDENDIRVDSKTFLENAKNKLEINEEVNGERLNLLSSVTNTLDSNENDCLAHSGCVHKQSMNLNMPKSSLHSNTFAHAKGNISSIASQTVAHHLTCKDSDSNKEKQNINDSCNNNRNSIDSNRGRWHNTSNTIKTKDNNSNDNVSVDFNNNNDDNNTISKLTSLSATATSQVQLWEQLVEENEDEDFSVASYAGQKKFFEDDDNSKEYNDDNNSSSNKGMYRRNAGSNLNIDIDNDYTNVGYEDDDDDDSNDLGRDDIY